MMNLLFTPLRPEHSAITPYLRQQDIDEIYASTDLPPELAVSYSITHSERGYAAILDGKICAVFGVNHGVIWLVGTDELARHPVAFFRYSKKIFTQLVKGYPLLENFVHINNTLSIRWLLWLGFTVEKPINNFHHVYYINKEV